MNHDCVEAINLFLDKDDDTWCGGKKHFICCHRSGVLLVLIVQVIGGFGEMVDVDLLEHIFCC